MQPSPLRLIVAGLSLAATVVLGIEVASPLFDDSMTPSHERSTKPPAAPIAPNETPPRPRHA